MSVEDWAEIRRLHRSEGMPIKAIARVMGVGRNTVRRALVAEGPPKRVPRGSKVDAVGAADPGVVGGLSADAGHGDRRAGRLGDVPWVWWCRHTWFQATGWAV
jgi:Helix-turn-helix domain